MTDPRLVDGRDLGALAEGEDIADALAVAADDEQARETLLDRLASLRARGLSRMIVVASARTEILQKGARISPSALEILHGIGNPVDDEAVIRSAQPKLRRRRVALRKWARLAALAAGFGVACLLGVRAGEARGEAQSSEKINELVSAVEASRDTIDDLVGALRDTRVAGGTPYALARLAVFEGLERHARLLATANGALSTAQLELHARTERGYVDGARQFMHVESLFRPLVPGADRIWTARDAVGSGPQDQRSLQRYELRCDTPGVEDKAAWTNRDELQLHPDADPGRPVVALIAPWAPGSCEDWRLESWVYLQNLEDEGGQQRPFGLGFSSPSLYATPPGGVRVHRIVDVVSDPDANAPFVLSPAALAASFVAPVGASGDSGWVTLGAGSAAEVRPFPDLGAPAELVAASADATWTPRATRRIEVRGNLHGALVYFYDQGAGRGVPLPPVAALPAP